MPIKEIGPSDGLEMALDLAWPDGVPQTERDFAARLSADLRTVVAKRLLAVMAWSRELKDAPAKVSKAATAAGVSPQRFYALAAGWRDTRSIAALGARAAEKTARPERLSPEVRAAVIETIRSALIETPSADVATIVRRLTERGVRMPSRVTIRRLWLKCRREMPPGEFGARLIFDSVGLDAVAGGERMRLYLVLDHGTGMVLGFAEATNRTNVRGLLHAAERAIEDLRHLDIVRFPMSFDKASVLLRHQKDDLPGAEILKRSFEEGGYACDASPSGLGRAAVEILGERLGPIWIGVGERDDGVSYRNGRPARLPEYTAELSVALEEALADHNDGRRAAAALAGMRPHPGARQALLNVQVTLSCAFDAEKEIDRLPGYSDGSASPSRARRS